MLRSLVNFSLKSSSPLYKPKRNFINKLSAANVMASQKPDLSPYDYYLVLDFEATCSNKAQINPQEIIEFPVLKVNSKTFDVESTFHQYVRPVFNPKLTDFCTELTGIIQHQVDEQPDFKETLQMFDEWMKNEGLLGDPTSSVFVTCGDWDLKTMMRHQCETSHLQIPTYFKRWINIKKIFCNHTGIFPKGMMLMLSNLNLKHVGRHHSGIDDCKNIAAILKELVRKGCRMQTSPY